MDREQFQTNMENLQIIITKLNKDIDILKKNNKKLKIENDDLYIKSKNPRNSPEYIKLKDDFNNISKNYYKINFILKKYNIENYEELDKKLDYYRNINIKKESNIIINRPDKVNFNKAFYNKYFEILLENNKKLYTNTRIINNNTKICKYDLCNNIIINHHIYCNYHYIEEKNKIEKIKKYTKNYNLKIFKKDIPIIIEHYKYEKSNLSDYQLVPYFDNNKYYNELLLLLNKYNLKFNINKKTSVKVKDKPTRNDYGYIDQGEEINKILDKLEKSRKICKRRYPDNNINLKINRYKLETYNEYYINSNKYDEDEKQLFFEQENIKYNKINKSRFFKYTKIFHKFHNDEIIRNSDYIFLPNTFKNINKKSIDMLIYKIKLLINNKYSLDDIKNNTFLEMDSEVEINDWGEIFNECSLCRENEALKDNDNGYCQECFDEISKPKKDINSIYEDIHRLYLKN